MEMCFLTYKFHIIIPDNFTKLRSNFNPTDKNWWNSAFICTRISPLYLSTV